MCGGLSELMFSRTFDFDEEQPSIWINVGLDKHAQHHSTVRFSAYTHSMNWCISEAAYYYFDEKRHEKRPPFFAH